MARRHYKLPSLTGLNTFDACARHGSLTQAAVELGVTLGAVSRQIKSLEADLGLAVFKRHHRGVELTKTGLELHQVLSSSFRNIGNVWQELKTRGVTADITIGATTGAVGRAAGRRLAHTGVAGVARRTGSGGIRNAAGGG